MKKIFVIIFGLVILLSGCNEDSNINEMKDCNSEICGYWKLYGIETYENNELVDVINSSGHEKLKITKDVFEMISYKENSMYNYQKDSYEYSNNQLKVSNTTYSVKIDSGDLLLSHVDSSGYTEILYYEKIEANEYPNINTSAGNVVYKSDTQIDCTEEYCGYWKLVKAKETCEYEEEEVALEEITDAKYLRFASNKLDRITKSTETNFEIESKNYYVLPDDVMENYYTLFTSDFRIDLSSIDNSDVAAEDMTIIDNKLTISNLVVYVEEEKFCVQDLIYEKIDKSEFPNINIYME